MNLALFDFDGTLTSKDSLAEFLKFSVDKPTYYKNMFLFLPTFILYKLKIVPNNIAKQKLFKQFFYGMKQDDFKQIAQEYSNNELQDIILDDRIKLLKEHQKNGDRIIIVSASMKCWLEPWCEAQKVELLSTRLEFIDGKFTGKFETANCYGIEKENRVREHLELEEFDKIYAYGDSAGDDAMLALADISKRF